MKIKSGAPRFQRTGKAGKAQKAEGTKSADAAEFSGLIEDEDVLDEREAKKVSQLMEELSGLAKDIEDGKTTKEEASRRFVGLVIKDRYGDDDGMGAAKMEESIADMVEDDPTFVTQLHSQLKKLAKG